MCGCLSTCNLPAFSLYVRTAPPHFQTHVARLGPTKCAFVRPMVFANKAMATRANLEAEVETQIQACGKVPPGNGPGGHIPLAACALKALWCLCHLACCARASARSSVAPATQ